MGRPKHSSQAIRIHAPRNGRTSSGCPWQPRKAVRHFRELTAVVMMLCVCVCVCAITVYRCSMESIEEESEQEDEGLEMEP